MKTAKIIDFSKARQLSRHLANTRTLPGPPAGFPLSSLQIWEFLDHNIKLGTLKTGR